LVQITGDGGSFSIKHTGAADHLGLQGWQGKDSNPDSKEYLPHAGRGFLPRVRFSGNDKVTFFLEKGFAAGDFQE
jgi:hypothetical protein